MSARIVVNLAQGPAECAIDRGPEGGTWLSLRQGAEVVIVKLATASLEALQLMLARELGGTSSEGTAPPGGEPAASDIAGAGANC
jgi:hypothetical protein